MSGPHPQPLPRCGGSGEPEPRDDGGAVAQGGTD